uniref:Ac81 n=1 Tax=Malacosoma sp. alphabaculovirus TaxID=1881632 RepID=A0A1B1V5G8_9ABAC|nr:ac81 [Malacosoma sp. alphabaculovirus]
MASTATPPSPTKVQQTPTTATTTMTTNFPTSQWPLRDKNLTTLNRIKYDPELLIHYIFDAIQNSEDFNVIRVCKIRVVKTGGTLLSHYYAHIEISNGYSFEFHPGSQPKTFQNVHTSGNIIMVLILCDECCKQELRDYIHGENRFNVAFMNCESILCKRKSAQTVMITLALLIIFLNMLKFSWYFMFFVLFIIVVLYINNNYLVSNPYIIVCPHKSYYGATQQQLYWTAIDGND